MNDNNEQFNYQTTNHFLIKLFTNMKKILYAAMAATVLFASCAKDGNEGGANGGPAEKAMLNISVTAPAAMGSRASGAAVPGDAITNYNVFIVDKTTNEINTTWSQYVASNAGITGKAVTTNAGSIYIVANSGDLTTSITSLADLTTFKADLNGAATIDGNQSTARWATGTSAITFTQSGNNFTASVNVPLTFIAARIVVTVDNQMTNQGAANALTLDGVAVMNARGESLLFPQTSGALSGRLVPSAYTANKKFYQGLANPTPAFANYPATSDFTMATGLLYDALTGTSTDSYYYYVFDNEAVTAATFPTIVMITGTDDNGDDLYWPVHLAPYEQFANTSTGSISATGIARGNSYNINIKLTGDATNGGGGTTDPTDPIVTAAIDVSLTLTPWVPQDLDKEF